MLPLYTTTAHGRKYRVYQEGDRRFLRIGDTHTTQSVGGSGATGFYYDEVAEMVPSSAESVLILGLGCGTMARRICEMRKSAGHDYPFIVGVDNDRTIIEIGRQYFDLERWVDVWTIEDARTFDPKGQRFDAVLLDCYVDATKRVNVDRRDLVAMGGVYIENVYDPERRTNDLTIQRL